MDGLRQDLRYGSGRLLRQPRLTLSILTCIGVGVGAAVFMFTLVNGVLLRPPPFPEADRLYRLRLLAAQGEGGQGDLSYLEFQDFKRETSSFDAVEMVGRIRLAVSGSAGTERLRGEAVSIGYFSLIGQGAALGRLFSPEEHAPGAPPVALISHGFWERSFGADPGVLGRSVRVRGRSTAEADRLYTVVGVMPADFVGTVDYDVADIWIPVEARPLPAMFERRELRNVWPILRLRSGASPAAARAEIEQVARAARAADPELYRGYDFRLEPFGESWRADVRTGLMTLMVAAGLLLLLACLDIAGLLLAALASRRAELTLRMVLGAQRRRVLRQLLIESVLLAVPGSLLGVALAFEASRSFSATGSIALPPYVSLVPDLRVAAFAGLLALLTAAAFGVVPALLAAPAEAGSDLREAGRGMTPGRRQRLLGHALIAAEVTFAFVLVVTGLLMVRTYIGLAGTDNGYRTDHVARLAITLDAAEYADAARQAAFADRAREELARVPGVRGLTLMAGVLPPHDDAREDLAIGGVPSEALRQVFRHAVDPGFLEVLDIALKWGRNLERGDEQGRPGVVLVSESLARFLGQGDAGSVLGRSLQLVADLRARELGPSLEIVGVVEDVRYLGPRSIHAGLDNGYDIYVSMYQFPGRTLSAAVRTEGDAGATLVPLRRALSRLAPTSPVHWVSTMESEMASQYADVRFYTCLTTGYSACALLLAGFGIYGVLAHAVSRRAGELGIRIAVGAQRRHILQLVLGQGMAPLALGLLLGATIAATLGRLVASLFYGVAPRDASSFIAVAATLVTLGLVACYLPARRALRTDPVTVLRRE